MAKQNDNRVLLCQSGQCFIVDTWQTIATPGGMSTSPAIAASASKMMKFFDFNDERQKANT